MRNLDGRSFMVSFHVDRLAYFVSYWLVLAETRFVAMEFVHPVQSLRQVLNSMIPERPVVYSHSPRRHISLFSVVWPCIGRKASLISGELLLDHLALRSSAARAGGVPALARRPTIVNI